MAVKKLTVTTRKDAGLESLWLVRTYHTGRWTEPYAEAFAETESGPATHLHIYDRETAAEAYRLGKMKLPETVRTVTYAE